MHDTHTALERAAIAVIAENPDLPMKLKFEVSLSVDNIYRIL